MALKYFLEYKDTTNSDHRLEIYDDAFVGTETEINGRVFLTHAQVDDPLDAIRGKGLRVELEADDSLTFYDLYTEDQKTIKVIYSRNLQTQFIGWMNPEGWYEDYVNAEWKVSFDCVDGLGYLENLSFVDDSGFPYTGKFTMLSVLSKALARTGLQHNINTDIDIYYNGLDQSLDVLANATINVERYVEDDGETIFSCDKVIRDILEPFTANVQSKNGEWFITRPVQISEDSIINYFRYDYLGAALTPAKSTLETAWTLGSFTDGFVPHHIQANQQINIKNSIGAYRINYKYGQLQSLFSNQYLCVGVFPDIPEWDVLSALLVSYPLSNGCGISLAITGYNTDEIVIESDPLLFASGLDLTLRFHGEVNRYPPAETTNFKYEVRLEDSGSSDIYYLRPNGTWLLNTQDDISKSFYANASWVIDDTMDPLPVAGNLIVAMYNCQGTNISGDGNGGIGGGVCHITQVELGQEDTGSGVQGTTIEGEFHTFQRTTKPSAQIKNIKEVFTGDNVEDNFKGAIYEIDGTTNTAAWNRFGLTDELPILGMMGHETMRASQKPARIFKGSVYGYFEYLSIVQINGLTGLFVPTSYEWDTKENIIDAEFIEIFTDELLDLDYQITFDYGNTVKPTIKG